MSGPFPARCTLTLMGMLIGVLIAAFLWVQWPEIAYAIEGVRIDEGLVWLIGCGALPVLAFLLFYGLVRLYFYFTGPRRAAKALERVEALKQDGQEVSLCNKCGGTGSHGASLILRVIVHSCVDVLAKAVGERALFVIVRSAATTSQETPAAFVRSAGSRSPLDSREPAP